MENNMTLEEIDAEITRLNNKKTKLLASKIAEFQAKATDNVGRCFLVNNVAVKVIGVPQQHVMLSGAIDFNKYQYPALHLAHFGRTIVPFREDKLFSAAWGEGHNVIGIDYKEITEEDFRRRFEDELEEFKNKVNSITQK